MPARGRLAHQVVTDPAGDRGEAAGRIDAGAGHRADQLVERVAPADVFAHQQQLAGRRDPGGGVARAGRFPEPPALGERAHSGDEGGVLDHDRCDPAIDAPRRRRPASPSRRLARGRRSAAAAPSAAPPRRRRSPPAAPGRRPGPRSRPRATRRRPRRCLRRAGSRGRGPRDRSAWRRPPAGRCRRPRSPSAPRRRPAPRPRRRRCDGAPGRAPAPRRRALARTRRRPGPGDDRGSGRGRREGRRRRRPHRRDRGSAGWSAPAAAADRRWQWQRCADHRRSGPACGSRPARPRSSAARRA